VSTKSGEDPLPFDTFISQAVSEDPQQFASACLLLQSIASRGRAEGGVFLLGLLSFYREDLRRLERVAEALQFFPCTASAQALLAELHRLAWSSTTRRYLNTVVATLMQYATPLVLEGFSSLASDPHQSVPARRPYRDIVDYVSGGPRNDGV
jgi:hypothetical protein